MTVSINYPLLVNLHQVKVPKPKHDFFLMSIPLKQTCSVLGLNCHFHCLTPAKKRTRKKETSEPVRTQFTHFQNHTQVLNCNSITNKRYILCTSPPVQLIIKKMKQTTWAILFYSRQPESVTTCTFLLKVIFPISTRLPQSTSFRVLPGNNNENRPWRLCSNRTLLLFYWKHLKKVILPVPVINMYSEQYTVLLDSINQCNL